MSEANSLMLYMTIYKSTASLVGLGFAYMGYRLFVQGIFTEAGELTTNWEDRSLVLRKAAPGTFFALFGTVVVCLSIWRGLTFGPGVDAGAISEASGMLGSNHSQPLDETGGPSRNTVWTRQTVLDDVSILNAFANDLLQQQTEGETAMVTVAVENSDQVLDLIDRAKITLMVSVWSQDWGQPEEFKKWATHAPGYFYGDPPTSIAGAAAIFKGESP